jgi:hypothetical protein
VTLFRRAAEPGAGSAFASCCRRLIKTAYAR